MLNYNKIQIAMLEISDQNKAVLEFYFSSTGEDLYNLVDKAKAEAFIYDYDYPGAKGAVKQLLETSDKPVVILSVREQNIPKTLWLAKPLSAAALTEAADTIKQMLSDIEKSSTQNIEETVAETQIDNDESVAIVVEETSLLDEVTETEVVIEETFLDETKEEVHTEIASEELVVEEKQETELINEINAKDEEPDFFELLAEANQEGEVVELTTTKTENLASLNSSLKSSAKSLINTNVANISEESIFDALLPDESSSTDGLDDVIDVSEENTESVDSSKLEFTDVVLDSQQLEENDHIESESEVDALLESLILGEDDSTHKVTENIDIEEDNIDTAVDDSNELLLESLLADTEIVEATTNEVIGDTTDEVKVTDAEDTVVLMDFSENQFLPELDIEEKESSVVEEEHSLIMEESFLIHDDLNPSDEGVYTETLEVDYSDVKEDVAEPETSLSVDKLIDVDDSSFAPSLEPSIDQAQEKSVEVEETLENDLFNFELEDDDTDVSSEAETIPSLTEIESTDNNDFSLDADIDKLDTDIDLDSLLEEVAIEDSFADKPAESKKASFTVLDVASIEDDIQEGSDKNSNKDFAQQSEAEVENNNSPDFELQSLLNEVRQEADKSAGENSSGSDPYEETEAEKRWIKLCGEVASIEEQKQVADISFDKEKHLLGVLLDQIESTKGSEQIFRLKYKDMVIVIDHSKNKIYCNLPTTTDDYAAVCFSELNPLEIKVHDLDYSEVRLYRSKMDENNDRSQSIESFVWTTTLLTSQGRLPKGTDIQKAISLKVWPNLTRLELMPHAMHIAAVFNKHPGSLLDVAKWLDIEQRYVFAFYNAALSLNMMELDKNKINKASFSFGKKGSDKKSEERGFFGRLLKRLKS
ncbi:MAG: hypothetical protein ACI88H_001406 [Cocleimonas sp.]|jgi:hypothetical protein